MNKNIRKPVIIHVHDKFCGGLGDFFKSIITLYSYCNIENIDYSYLESLYDKQIPESVISQKFGHERPMFDSDLKHIACDLEINKYENKNVKLHHLYDDNITRTVYKIYKTDLIFFFINSILFNNIFFSPNPKQFDFNLYTFGSV